MSLARKTVNFAREKSVSSPNSLDYIIFTDIYPVGRALRKTFGSNLQISCRFRVGLLDGYPRPRAAKFALLIYQLGYYCLRETRFKTYSYENDFKLPSASFKQHKSVLFLHLRFHFKIYTHFLLKKCN